MRNNEGTHYPEATMITRTEEREASGRKTSRRGV